MVRFHIGPMVAHVITHVEGVQHVLVDNYSNYHKAPRMNFLSDFLGMSLLTLEDDGWKRRRKLAQPAFHKKRLVEMSEPMVAHANRMVDGWAPTIASGAPLDISAQMTRITLGVVGEALFGVDMGELTAEIEALLPLVLKHTLDRMNSVVPLPLSFPTPANRRYHAARTRLHTVVGEMIARLRAGRHQARGVMAMLMDARDEETGAGLTDEELRSEAMTLMFAGHETTANALSWTWWLLAQNPEAAARLREEVRAALGTRAPTADDLPALAYVANVVQEAMRLMPPSWAIGRMPLEDDEVLGFHIPAKSMVLLAPCVTHRDPTQWPDPDRFDPDRFTPARSVGRHRMAYIPFSAGPRVCIGASFSMMEATLIVAVVTQRAQLELDPTQEVSVEPSLTLRPRDGIRMIVRGAEA